MPTPPDQPEQAPAAPLSGPFKYGARRTALNVRHLMLDRGFRSVASLHRALISRGCEISHPQLLRIIDNKAKLVSLDVIDALINLFDCPPSALFVEVSPAN